jgi:hypothetical protein
VATKPQLESTITLKFAFSLTSKQLKEIALQLREFFILEMNSEAEPYSKITSYSSGKFLSIMRSDSVEVLEIAGKHRSLYRGYYVKKETGVLELFTIVSMKEPASATLCAEIEKALSTKEFEQVEEDSIENFFNESLAT